MRRKYSLRLVMENYLNELKTASQSDSDYGESDVSDVPVTSEYTDEEGTEYTRKEYTDGRIEYVDKAGVETVTIGDDGEDGSRFKRMEQEFQDQAAYNAPIPGQVKASEKTSTASAGATDAKKAEKPAAAKNAKAEAPKPPTNYKQFDWNKHIRYKAGGKGWSESNWEKFIDLAKGAIGDQAAMAAKKNWPKYAKKIGYEPNPAGAKKFFDDVKSGSYKKPGAEAFKGDAAVSKYKDGAVLKENLSYGSLLRRRYRKIYR